VIISSKLKIYLQFFFSELYKLEFSRKFTVIHCDFFYLCVTLVSYIISLNLKAVNYSLDCIPLYVMSIYICCKLFIKYNYEDI